MSLIPYQSNGAMTPSNSKNKNRKNSRKNQATNLQHDITAEVAKWGASKLASAVKGIVSAFRQNGSSKQEMSRIVAPLAQTMRLNPSKPRFGTIEGGVRISHTEAFAVESFDYHHVVTSESYQWLANMAKGYEEWRIKAEYAYVPVCAATTSGSVMIAFDYDPVDTFSYTSVSDFFNTADHCVSAVWAPAAVTPKISSWLKTGINGNDPRLFSPGTIHVKQTSSGNGFFLVRYVVELRKAQPIQEVFAEYTGTFTPTTLLSSPELVAGQAGLLESISPTTIKVTQTGNSVVMWSTAENVATIATGGTVIGQTNNSSRTVVTWYSYESGDVLTLTQPVGTQAGVYKLTIFNLPIQPMFV